MHAFHIPCKMQVAKHQPADDDEPRLVDRGLLAGVRSALLPSRQVWQHQDDGVAQRRRRRRHEQHPLIPGLGRRLHRPGAIGDKIKFFLARPHLTYIF